MATSKEKLQYPGFSYEGGKWKLRPWIMDYIPFEGSLYVEPFAGRGNVFWMACQLKKYSSWWLNDIRTKPFYEAIKTVDLARLPTTIIGLDEIKYENMKEAGDDLAWVLEPVLCWSGQALGNTFRAKLDARTPNKQPSLSYSRIKYGRAIATCRAILNHYKPTITDIDILSLPWSEWNSSVFAYLDPPYLDAKVVDYSDEDFDHLGLIKVLKATKARWLFSEYAHPLYMNHLGTPLAIKHCHATMSNSQTTGGKRAKRIECLWSNYSL